MSLKLGLDNPKPPQIIVGLDVSSVSQAELIVQELGGLVSFYKVGYQLFFSGGIDFVKQLIAHGKQVFLDLKLLDIDNTVFSAVEKIIGTGVSMLTIHAYPKVMKAAIEASKGSPLCLLGVTALTSMNDDDLTEAGYRYSRQELVLLRAKQIFEAGMDGVVCSPQEIEEVRRIVGPHLAVVTPGIRPVGYETNDHKCSSTPSYAIGNGASHIVIARPIIYSKDRASLVRLILEEMKNTA